MNAHRHRLVFNRARGLVMAVAEIACARGKNPATSAGPAVAAPPGFSLAKLRPAAFAVLLAAGAQLAVVPLADAQVVAYKAAPPSQQPTVLQAGNGVPLVNIQTPSAAGVSRNTYSQFDVQTQGAILNNSRTNAQTQLGGWVQGNPWLARGSARVILNEVVSANPSQLLGYVEVAGSAAQVVIANPAGVTCNGCGFINASRATLTTGTPIVGSNLDGYRVEGGTIRIEGAGMDASRVGYTDLIARAVEVNAGIWAQTLKVTAGTNVVSADNSQVTPIAGTGAAPAFAIDVAQLGGMYAGKIMLVGTEAGVGVRNAGYLGASAGEVVVTADGRLTNSGSLIAAGNVGVDARAGVTNTGTVYAQGDLDLATRGDVDNAGGLVAAGSNATVSANGAGSRIAGDSASIFAAGLHADGSFAGSGKLAMTATESIATSGRQLAGGDLAMNAISLNLADGTNSAQNISLTASAGDLDLSRATTVASGTLAAHAVGALIHNDAKSNAGQLDLAAASLANVRGEIVQTGSGDTAIALAGDLDNTEGRIAGNSRNLSLAAQTLTNTDGRIEHAGIDTLTIATDTFAGTRGLLVGNGTLALTAQTATLDAASTVAETLAITAGALSNQGGEIIQTGAGEGAVSVSGRFDNRGGTLAGNGGLALTIGEVDNRSAGLIASAFDLVLAAGAVANDGGSVNAGRNLRATVTQGVGNTAGRVAAGRDLAFAAASFDNTDGTLGAVAGSLTADIAGTLGNTRGRIEAAQTVALAGNGLTNVDGTVVGNALSIDTRSQALDNTRGRLAAASTADLQSGALTNQAGLIQAAGALNVDTHGQTLDNTSDGSIVGQLGVMLSAGALDNSGGAIGAKGALIVGAGTLTNASGRIVSEADASLTVRQFDNRGGQIQSAGNLTARASDRVDNGGGLMRAGGTLTVDTASLINANTQGGDQGIEGQAVAITANAIDNRSGAVRADTTLTVTSSGTLNNGSGLISSAQTVAIRDTGTPKALAITNTAGTIIAGERLDIDSASLSGDGKLLSLGDLAIRVVADYTHTGELTADGRATFETTGTLTNQATMQADTRLALTAATIDNRAAGEIRAPELRLTATDTHTLTNRGLIDGGDTRLDAVTLNNLGTGRIYGDHLSIAAATLNNEAETINGVTSAPAIAARSRLNLGVGSLNNREGALIFSTGDLAIGGALDADNRAAGQAGTVNNASATIEALGSLALNAAQINNTNEHFSTQLVTVGSEGIDEWVYGSRYRPDQVSLTWTKSGGVYHPPAYGGMDYMAGQGFFSDNSNNYVYLNSPSGSTRNFWLYTYTRTTQETQVIASAPGRITSGGDMLLTADALRNDNSQILAGGNLVGTFGSVDNTATAGQRIVSDSGTAWYVYRDGDHHDSDRNTYGYNPAATVSAISLSASRVEGNTAPGGSGTAVGALAVDSVGQGAAGAADANGSVGAGSAVARITQVSLAGATGGSPTIAATVSALGSLPNSSLVRQNPDPGHLIATVDPRFADYRQWLSSDYMLAQLALDPATTQKRLGDGFVEQRLVTEQVAQLTGRRFLVGYANEEAQYRALMDAGIAFAQAWNLRPGVALSAAQMAALTSDLVWLVEQEVTLADGSRQKALVPQLYARIREGDLAPAGGLLADQSLDLTVRGNPSTGSGGTLTNLGTLAGRQLVSLSADSLRNLGGRIAGNEIAIDTLRDFTLQGGSVEAGDRLAVRAGGNLDIASTVRSQGGRSNLDRVAALYVNNPGGTLQLAAAGDINLIAAQLINSAPTAAGVPGGTTRIDAGGNLTLGTVATAYAETVGGGRHVRREAGQSEVGTTIDTAGDLALNAGKDLTARAVSVTSSSGAIAATAGNDLRIESGEARTVTDEQHRYKSKGFLSKKTTTTRDGSEDSTALASTFSGDRVTLTANRDIAVKGSNVVATGDTTVIAGRDLAVEAATETHRETHFVQKKKSGLSASLASGVSIDKASSTQSDRMAGTTAVGSAIGGDNVLLSAGRDASVSGSQVIADRDLDVLAGRDANILAAQNTYSEEHRFKSKSSSLQLIGGAAPRQTLYGTNSAAQQSTGSGNTATASLLSANAGNLTVTAGTDTQHANTGRGNVTSEGADLLAGRDLRLEGNAVNLLASEANSQLDSVSKTKSFTVGAALAGTVGGTITRAYDMAKAAADGTGNRRLDAAMTLKAGYDAYKAIDGAGKAVAAAADGAAAKNGALGNGSAFGVSASIGSSKSQSESHEQSHSERGTNIQAENIAITARETDIVAVGAKIEAARNVTLDAQRDLRLLAATNTEDIERRNKGSNVGLGVTFGVGQQTGISFQIGASQTKGKTDGHETTYDNTRVTAGETLTLKSGGDTALKGAQVGGRRVEAEIGGRLDIETLQDRSDYQSKQTNGGFSLSLCIPPICYGTSSGSVSAAQQKIEHSYQSAVGQSGIAAGEGGFDLKVGGDTHLKGGAITSTADAAQNRLTTRSLSYEDLENRQRTSASSYSLSLSGSVDPSKGLAPAPSTSLAGQAASNLLANLGGQQGLPKSGSERSQTLAVISPATITLTGTDDASRQAATTLTGRDAATANQALTNTLALQDAARVEQKMKDAQQNAQAASLIGQVAAGMIGDLATAMRKPINDAELRQTLDAKQAKGEALSNVERYELARLDKEGMSSAQAAQTLKDPAAQANATNWQEGSANKILLHGLAGVITAKVGNGNVLVGAATGAVNEAVIPAMSDYLKSQGITPEKNLEEYKGYMQLGSALLGAGLGAVADGKNGAALGATVAHNATTYNYLKHQEVTRLTSLKVQKLRGECGAACEQEIKQLEALDVQRNRDLAACEGVNSSPCDTLRTEVRQAAAEYIRADQINTGFRYGDERQETLTLAENTMGGIRVSDRAAGYGQTVWDGVSALAAGAVTAGKAVLGDEQAKESVRQGAGAAWDYVKEPENWPYLLGAMTPENREKLAQAYEAGDARTIGRMMGEQFANMPIGGAGFGTVKRVGKAVDGLEDATKAATKGSSPVDIAHTIGADYNLRTGKVTGGHTLLNDDVKIKEVVSPPDANGVYEAIVDLKKPDGEWATKTVGRSDKPQINTMFPKDWDAVKIQREIESAWANQRPHPSGKTDMWIGKSSSGIEIQGYKEPRATAYPVYGGIKP